MKIYTKTGDGGETGLFGGKRVAKNSPIIEAIGEVDELNAHIGLCRAALATRGAKRSADMSSPARLAQILAKTQQQLFSLGAALSTNNSVRAHVKSQPTKPPVKPAAISDFPSKIDRLLKELEDQIDDLEAQNTKLSGSPLKNFIRLPAGCEAAARLHAARAVCRRAERAVVGAAEAAHATATTSGANSSAPAIKYLNRLSDLLFVMARYTNLKSGAAEEKWTPREG
ncbi:cob(I)yrinic acid a,c-diamide adenosyltransferase [Patescibacteria group bacterium]|nr:cob(I)yrinic acid a,c-diamide adenosyltransferase [Patescibacteria group bacterium]MBU1703429.1 cob(I)yrinic acid a,c-diamide adenosyltransferase [Patescibacteria group bacterium]MBU1953632.1 cob(I)yrinic acid a,c-diamide adenosyltransferase [Patescibacteria group bacterium]